MRCFEVWWRCRCVGTRLDLSTHSGHQSYMCSRFTFPFGLERKANLGLELQGLSCEIEQAIYEANNNETHNDYRSLHLSTPFPLPPIVLTNFSRSHCIRSRILNLKDKNNPLLRSGILSRDISPLDFAYMSSEEMASPQRRQENIRMRRNSLTQTVGVNDLRPMNVPSEDIPGEPGMNEMGRSGQMGVEYQRPV